LCGPGVDSAPDRWAEAEDEPSDGDEEGYGENYGDYDACC